MRLFLLSIWYFILLSITAPAIAGGGGVQFIENKGQWDNKILYRSAIPSGDIFFERNGLTFNLYDGKNVVDAHVHGKANTATPNLLNFHAFKLNFSGANKDAAVFSAGQFDNYYNYYIGKDQTKWASHVNAFNTVIYKGIYDDIDLSVKATGKSVKYEFAVAPGANTNKIVLDFEGANALKIVNENLLIETSVTTIQEQKPYAYQIINGLKIEVPCNFVLNGTKVSYGFPHGYNEEYALVIDPVLVFCSYSGSLSDNWGFTATYDLQGNLFAGGVTFDNGYPLTLGAFQQQFGLGSCDAAISKYTSNGTSFVYSTYLGGNGADQPHSMIVNANDELYIYGSTGSTDFPVTAGAFDQSFNGGSPVGFDFNFINFTGGSDIYIAHLKNDGTALLGCTYFGGSGNDGLNTGQILQYNYADQSRGEIYIDQAGNIVIGSSTYSTDLPVTSGTFQGNLSGAQDGLVAKFNSSLTGVIWATYVGGPQDDAVYSVFGDKTGGVYFTGGTASQTFPVTGNTIHPAYLGGVCDAYIGHLSANGQQMLRSTFYGSNQYDQTFFVQVDKKGYVYVVGQTEAAGNVLISNATFNNPGGNQFIAKMSSGLDTLIWSTAFGKAQGKPDISPSAFLVDVCSKVYVSGWGALLGGQNPNNANTTGLPISNNAYQSTTDGADYYLLVIDDDASSLVYGSYFGGPVSEEHVDGGTSRFDKQGIIYQSVCAGCGSNDDLPTTTNSVSQTNNSDNCNNGVFKFDFQIPLSVANFTTSSLCPPYNITFTNTSGGLPTSYQWNFGDNSPISTATNPTHTYSQPGTYSVTLIATNPQNCNIADTLVREITLVDFQTPITLSNDSTCPGVPVQIGSQQSLTGLTYNWQPSAFLNNHLLEAPTATVNSNTVFTLIVSNGSCYDTLTQSVIINPLVAVNVGNDTTICPGDTIQIGFAENSGNYTYNWTPSAGLSDNTIPNPFVSPNQTQTTYVLYVTPDEGFGCPNRDSIKVTVALSETVAGFTFPSIGCAPYTVNFNNTSINGVNYVWDFDDASTSTSASPSHLYTAPGVYNVVLISENINSCKTLDTTTVPVVIPGLNVIDTLPPIYTCKKVPVQIGIPPVSDTTLNFNWQPAIYLNNATIPNPMATVSSDTVFILNISKPDSCAGIFYQRVYVIPALAIDAGNDVTICEGYSAQIGFTDTATNVHYQWLPATGLSNDTISNPIASPSQTTVYTLVASSAALCPSTDSLTVTIYAPPPVANFTYTVAPHCNELTLNLTNTSIGGTQFYWGLNGTYFPANGDTGLFLQYSSTYTISIIAANPYCSDTFTVTINTIGVNGYLQLNESNVFTPQSGDNINPCFSPALPQNLAGIDPETYPLLPCTKLTIYNRWGRKIWEGAGCWDGYTEGGNEVTDGVYYYIFELDNIKTHGAVHVVR